MSDASLHARAEQSFGRWGRWVVQHPWTLIVASGIVTVALLSGLPSLRAEFSEEGYLRAGDDSLEIYDAFRDRYGRDSRTLIGVQPRAVFDLDFLTRLKALHEDLERSVPHLEEVQSLWNARSTRGVGDELVVEDLGEQWPGDAAALADFKENVLANRLYMGTFVSHNHDFAALSIRAQTYTSIGAGDELDFDDDVDDTESEYLTNQETFELIAALYEVVERHDAEEFRLFLVGREVMGDRLQRISESNMILFSSLSIAIIILVLWLMFRRVSSAVLPLIVVVLSIVATFGAMGHLGIAFSTVTQVLPTFLIAVGICDSVHILAIAYRRLAEGDTRQVAVAHAIEHSGLAVVLTSLTTAAGLVSFIVAEISPVAELGVIAPIGVVLTLAYTLTLLPALLSVVPLRASARGAGSGASTFVDALLVRMGRVSTSRPRTVLVCTAIVLAVAFLGFRQARLSNDSLSWLFADDPVRVALETLDREIDGISSLEVLIDTGRENGLYEPDVMRRIDQTMRYAESIDGPVTVGKAVSIVDVVKEINQALHENRAEFYRIPDDRKLIAQELLLFENSGSDDLEELADNQFREARVTVQVKWADGQLYVPFLQEFRQRASEILGDELPFEMTGSTALASRAFSLLLTSLVRSYSLALLVITPLMILVIGNFRRGLLAMIPNLIPVYLTLALAGFAEIPLNISTMLIGGVVIGLAVDDTIHFMHKWGRYYEASGDPREAVRQTFETTGTALVVTTFVLASSFLVFVAGDFYGVVHFGILAAFAAVIALLADVLVAPALMVLSTSGEFRRAAAQAA